MKLIFSTVIQKIEKIYVLFFFVLLIIYLYIILIII